MAKRIEWTKSIVSDINRIGNIASLAEGQEEMGRIAGLTAKADFETKVRRLAIAPTSVAQYEQARSESTGKARTRGEHAALFGGNGTDFTQQEFCVLVCRFGAGLECPTDAGWDAVTYTGPNKVKVTIPQAWQNLVTYRSENRDPADVKCAVASAALAFVSSHGEVFTEAVQELIESFGHLAAMYNVGRGFDPSGKVSAKEEDQNDDQGDEDEDDDENDPSVSWQEFVTTGKRRADEAGVSQTEMIAFVRSLYEA